jgi:hypothetical protein
MNINIDRVWKDKDGNQAVFQKPNIWITFWAALTLAALTVGDGDARAILGALATVSLIAWSGLEIFTGDSYFRQILGCIVFVAIIIGLTDR